MSTIEIVSLSFSMISSMLTVAWFLRERKIKREEFPKIEMDCHLEEICKCQGGSVAQVIVSIKNSGHVRHTFRRLRFDLLGNDLSQIVEEKDQVLGQVQFPIQIRKKQNMFPREWVYSFVDAGSTSTYRNILFIPDSAKLLSLTARMFYDDADSDFHSCSWTGKI